MDQETKDKTIVWLIVSLLCMASFSFGVGIAVVFVSFVRYLLNP